MISAEKILTNSLAALTAVMCAGAVCAMGQESGAIMEGRYATLADGVYHNYQTFSCSGNGAEYCSSLASEKLTAEEQKVADGHEISADFVLRYENGVYALAGNAYILRTCYLTTARGSKNYGSYIPQQCEYNRDAELLKCMLYEPYEYDERGEQAGITVYFSYDGDALAVDNVDLRGNSGPSYEGCARELSEAKFHYESDSAFEHSQYLSTKLEFMLTDGAINKLWKSLDPDTRAGLKKEQIKWIKKKAARCGEVTMKGSDAELIKMLNCQREMTLERIEYLSSKVD